jgi:molybdate transport system substrate-binding protein
VKIVATIPDDTHPPIPYPFAITAASHNESAAQFLDFLKSPAAREILEAQGFGVIPP